MQILFLWERNYSTVTCSKAHRSSRDSLGKEVHSFYTTITSKPFLRKGSNYVLALFCEGTKWLVYHLWVKKKLLFNALVSKTSICPDYTLDFIVTAGTKLEYCYWTCELFKEFGCLCVSLFIAMNDHLTNFSLPTALISVSLCFFLYFIKSLIPHLIQHLSVQGANTFLTQL